MGHNVPEEQTCLTWQSIESTGERQAGSYPGNGSNTDASQHEAEAIEEKLIL